MTSLLSRHLELVLQHASDGVTTSIIPRVEISIGSSSGEGAPCLYRSMICFILQGSKSVAINRELLSYDANQYLISALELSVMGQIFDVGEGRPYVAVSLVVDPVLVADIAANLPSHDSQNQSSIGIDINPITEAISEPLLRLLSLLNTPADIPALAPLAEREMIYRLLQGPQGRLLRQIAQPEGPLGRVRRAVSFIRDHQNTTLHIDALCDVSGMSRATLHRHFASITGVSPLQYQKQLRLQEARQLLVTGERNASEVAYAVGYESASQFNREYVRQFGSPPARDVRQLRMARRHSSEAQSLTAGT